MKENIDLKAGNLYLMVGLPASGKSGLLAKQESVLPEMIISTDKIRTNFVGNSYKLKANGDVLSNPLSSSDNDVWDIATKMLRSRLSDGLTTFFDAASMVKAGERERMINIANQYGVDVVSLVLPIDPEQSKKYDAEREFSVGGSVIDKFYAYFNEHDGYDALKKENHINVDFNTKFNLVPNRLPNDKFDIIGDVHGLYDDFIIMLENDLGYYKNEKGLYEHPEGRKLFLLGDFLDRGQQSIEMLRFAYNHHNDGHKFILGNHENKLLNFVRFHEKGKVIRMSPSSSLTASDFLKLDKVERERLYKFLLKLPKYFLYENNDVKIAFAHANLQFFDPFKTPSSYLMYSDQNKNGVRKRSERREVPLHEKEDYAYSVLFEKGINKYYYVRGHIRCQYDDQKHVLSLDDEQAFDGNFVSVKLEDLESSIRQGLGVNNQSIVKRIKTTSGFDFKKFEEDNLKLYKIIKRLQKEKLATESKDESGLLSVFKYKKDVFFKRKWEQEADLLSCRGIVFDFSGRIAQYPFDKVFNYSEPNEKGEATAVDVDKDTKYIAVEKINGFLGNITKNPFKNELLYSTTGSLTSDFVGYISDMVKGDDVYGDLMSFFSKGNDNMTLMFEVVHPDDPHIVEYNKSDHGIYLIGAREKVYNSRMLTEKELDDLAKEIGLRRPDWKIKTLGEALNDMKTIQHEGYMLRDLETEKIDLKLKSSYYLGVKFVSRMGEKKIRHMFKNPMDFKKRIDEEFFPLVDKITKELTQSDFLAMDKDSKLKYVRDIMDKSYEDHGLGVKKEDVKELKDEKRVKRTSFGF